MNGLGAHDGNAYTNSVSGSHTPELSVIVPVYNEEENVAELHRELLVALAALNRPYEILYINDGSRDGTLSELTELPGATIIDLRRNYGQAVALDAGFKAARGEVVVSLDGDGQNDPNDIGMLLSMLEEQELDVVAGWRKHRQDKGGIRFITRTARLLRRYVIGDTVHDTGCTLRVYTRDAAKSLDIGGEMHRYILALLRWKGFRIGEAVVNHRPRMRGVSKYGYSKALRGFIDLMYIWFIHKYSQRPLHLFGYLSAGSFVIGVASLCWSVYGKLVMGLSLNRNGWFFLTFFFLTASIMFFSFGIIIDMLIRNMFHVSLYEKRYYVRRVIVNEGEQKRAVLTPYR
jgi:glycosyltransferase involved in cell wall biosynthesis